MSSASGLVGLGLGAVGFVQGLLNGPTSNRFTLIGLNNADGTPQLDASGTPATQAFAAYVTMIEDHDDETQITDHPVAQGTRISDHAFSEPATLTCEFCWSPSSPALGGSGTKTVFGVSIPTFTGLFGGGQDSRALLAGIYEQVRQAQRSRCLITVSTGKRLYTNMLIKRVRERTAPETENVLTLTITFRELLIARTVVINSPINTAAGAQAQPQATTPPVQRGSTSPAPSSVPTKATTSSQLMST